MKRLMRVIDFYYLAMFFGAIALLDACASDA